MVVVVFFVRRTCRQPLDPVVKKTNVVAVGKLDVHHGVPIAVAVPCEPILEAHHLEAAVAAQQLLNSPGVARHGLWVVVRGGAGLGGR